MGFFRSRFLSIAQWAHIIPFIEVWTIQSIGNVCICGWLCATLDWSEHLASNEFWTLGFVYDWQTYINGFTLTRFDGIAAVLVSQLQSYAQDFKQI